MHAHTQGDHHINTKAETGVMQLQAQEFQGLQGVPEARREVWNRFSLSHQKEPTLPTLVSDCWPPKLTGNAFLLFEATVFVVTCCGSPRKFLRPAT